MLCADINSVTKAKLKVKKDVLEVLIHIWKLREGGNSNTQKVITLIYEAKC